MIRKYNAMTNTSGQFNLEHITFPVLICPRVSRFMAEESGPDQEENEFPFSSPAPPPALKLSLAASVFELPLESNNTRPRDFAAERDFPTQFRGVTAPDLPPPLPSLTTLSDRKV
jgi:hypothetical protein